MFFSQWYTDRGTQNSPKKVQNKEFLLALSPFAGNSIKQWYSAPFPYPSYTPPSSDSESLSITTDSSEGVLPASSTTLQGLESNIKFSTDVNKSAAISLFDFQTLSKLQTKYGFVQMTSSIYGSPGLPVLPLPFYSYVKLPVPNKDMDHVTPMGPAENCVGKAIVGMVGGGVLGIGMGLFLGMMGDLSPAIPIINGKEAPPAPLKEQMHVAYKSTLEKCMSWSKSFFVLTALFSGVDCVIEKYRGKHDGYTSLISGCLVGGAMSASQGPQAACLGCVGFAAFSAVAEAIMGPH